jgi:hypothetical protein
MGKRDPGFDYDRYRKLLAEAVDEEKRLALIDLMVDEKARQKLSEHVVRERLAEMGLTAKPRPDQR